MRRSAVIATATYAATIPAANWMISNVGTEAFPGGPHVIPVGFGLDAPSGVLMIGAALVARDAVQRLAGRRAAVAAIVVGAALSYAIAPSLAVASAVAFLLGELADFAVYSPLAERRLVLAVIASGIVGGVIDSLVFLHLAFGSFDFWQGQVIGKAWMAVIGGAVLWVIRRAVSDRVPAVR
jgi:queuosine precursor transporter